VLYLFGFTFSDSTLFEPPYYITAQYIYIYTAARDRLGALLLYIILRINILFCIQIVLYGVLNQILIHDLENPTKIRRKVRA